ncbi:Uncharacterized protein TCM_000768 [Theobroma cacao]|uniref:Uncharacterized protein n=1 Tax=Theobroma cacao TaxID=3641 RepID=A0A061DGW1_THECC|nr:Uncharacterized protein TCM_000768 [Theobroma cacao]
MELLNIGMREKEKLQKIAQGPKNYVKFCIRAIGKPAMDKKLPIGEGTKINGTSEWEKTAKAAATTVPVREMEEIVDIKNFSPVSKSISSCVC